MTEPIRPLKPVRRDPARLAAAQAGGTGGGQVGPLSDPAIAKALQLKSFERLFDVEDLIGTLSDKQITASKARTGAFDPKPFIKTFSPALDQLLTLRKQVSEKTEALEEGVRKAEREYSSRLKELDGGFETIGSSFSALETKITGVGRTAVRIGEQLESLHHSRSLAQSTSVVLSYYISLAQPVVATPVKSPDGTETTPPTPMDALFATRTTKEGRQRLAVILRRLTTLSKDVRESISSTLESLRDDVPAQDAKGKGKPGRERMKLQADLEKAERVQEEVEKYGERFEKECLRLFDRSYRKGDVRLMAHCAKILLDFNGGHSCVQIYVNQHDFFISKDRVLEEAAQSEEQNGVNEDNRPVKWEELSDRDAVPPTSETGLNALFKEIRVTVEQEAQIIQAVFPMKEEVLQVFLQRVFAQVIQQHLEQLFSRASSMSSLALLRMLRLTHAMCSRLVEDLKQYDFSGGAGVSTGSSKQGGNVTALATLLDQAMDEIFVPFVEDQHYVELEIKNLSQGYQKLLSKFSRYHESVIKSKSSTLLDRVVNQLTASSAVEKASAATSSSAASAASAAAAWLNKYSGTGLKDASRIPASASGTATPQRMTPKDGDEEKVWEVDGVLRLQVAEQILRWHAEAIGRVVELSASGDVPKNTLTLSKLLSDFIGWAYLELQLDSSLVKLDITDSKVEPDLKALSSLRQTDLILHLWQKYSATALIPLTANAVISRRELTTLTVSVVSRLEAKVNAILQRTIEASMTHLTAQLAKQKRNDYKPKDDDLSFARTTTEPCVACCEYIENLRDAAKLGLSGANLETLLVEIGVGFHSLLLEHYKKFPVNPTGGLMLTKDLAAYQELFQSFRLSSSVLNDRFDMLRQLGNSFIVQPDVLKSYLTESYLGRIDMRLLRPYLMQRSDWTTFARQFNISDEDTITVSNVPTESTSASQAAGKGFLRTSRLSMGIGSAGLGRLRDVLKDIDAHAFDDDNSPGSSKQPPGSPRTLSQQRQTGNKVPQSPSYGMLPIH